MTAPRTIRDDGGAAAGDAIPAGPLTRRQLPFSVVAKPTGAACNLDCQYCFFLSKELLYATKRQQMNEETSANMSPITEKSVISQRYVPFSSLRTTSSAAA